MLFVIFLVRVIMEQMGIHLVQQLIIQDAVLGDTVKHAV